MSYWILTEKYEVISHVSVSVSCVTKLEIEADEVKKRQEEYNKDTSP